MRFREFRLAGGLIALSALLLLPLGCSPREAEPDPAAERAETLDKSLVRFVNATGSVKPIDLYLDDAKAIAEVEANTVTAYAEWSAERHDIQLKTSDAAQPVAQNSESLGAGERYTVVGFSKADGTAEVAVFRDDISKPGEGKARIRLIHVADGATEVDIVPAGAKETLVDGVNFNTASYAEVDPGVKSLEVRKEGEKAPILKIPELTLEPGKTHTIVIAMNPVDRKLRAIQVTDDAPALTTPTQTGKASF
jgi:hypothetical protein